MKASISEQKDFKSCSCSNRKPMMITPGLLMVKFPFCKNRLLPLALILLVVISGAYVLSPTIMKKYADNDNSGAEQIKRSTSEGHLAFSLKMAGYQKKSLLVKRFKNCIASICEHSTIPLTFHIIANEDGKRAATEAFDEVRKTCSKDVIVKTVYYDLEDVVKRLQLQISEIKKATQNEVGMQIRDPLYFFPIVMDQILPTEVDRVIKLDADFYFQSNIKQLFDHFDHFKSTTIFGMARVLRHTYLDEFRKYRASHPGTKIGDPPPDGVTGYNGGLVMINLNRMRKSTLYKQLLRDNVIKTYADKYEFKGTRAEQDFFVLLDIEHHELFYVVPCTWNRQLCYQPPKTGPDPYVLYNNCPDPIHAYHGNCHVKMPNEQ